MLVDFAVSPAASALVGQPPWTTFRIPSRLVESHPCAIRSRCSYLGSKLGAKERTLPASTKSIFRSDERWNYGNSVAMFSHLWVIVCIPTEMHPCRADSRKFSCSIHEVLAIESAQSIQERFRTLVSESHQPSQTRPRWFTAANAGCAVREQPRNNEDVASRKGHSPDPSLQLMLR